MISHGVCVCVFALSSSVQDMSKSVQEFKMNGPAKETGERDNMVASEECVSQRFYQVPHIDTNPLKTTSLTVGDIQPCYVVSSIFRHSIHTSMQLITHYLLW